MTHNTLGLLEIIRARATLAGKGSLRKPGWGAPGGRARTTLPNRGQHRRADLSPRPTPAQNERAGLSPSVKPRAERAGA